MLQFSQHLLMTLFHTQLMHLFLVLQIRNRKHVLPVHLSSSRCIYRVEVLGE